jgi:hypothetical protein
LIQQKLPVRAVALAQKMPLSIYLAEKTWIKNGLGMN